MTPSGSLGHAGQVVVVTGASRGLGAGMAEAFAGEGMRLGLCARQRPEAPTGAEAVSRSVDVTDVRAIDGFTAEVVGRFGRIDLWINNAGELAPIGPLADADPSAVRHQMDVNVMGVIHGTGSFARHVRARTGPGLLINISSGAATRPYEGWAPYCGSKAAVDMITAVVAREEQPNGLRAFALAPGVVDTDMQALIRSTPVERFPDVARFHQLSAQGGFNSSAWVARFILGLLGQGDQGDQGDGEPLGGVRRSVPPEH